MIENYWDSMFKRLFRKLKDCKGVKYIKLQSNSIFYLYQYVFVNYTLLRQCKSLETLKFSNYAGVTGKGTIAFKFKIENESFAFLTAHLSAHDYGNTDRINHYKRVIKEDTFYDYSRILNCSFAFYAGDLNFRLINLDIVELINDLNSKGRDEKYLESLYSNDQLKIAQREGTAFGHFSEGKIRFRPTFKFHPDTEDYNPKRTPSWCDRILYRVKEKKKIDLLFYDSVDHYIQSDHRPVVAVFDLTTEIKTITNLASNVHILSAGKTDVDNKLDVWVNKKMKPEIMGFNLLLSRQDRADSEESARDRPAGWDWIGLFKEDFDDLDDYLAYLYVEDVHCNEELPEEIAMKMCNIEKAEEAFEIEAAKEAKEGESIGSLEDQPSSSSSRSEMSSGLKDDPKFKELAKKIEWSKLEFSEQTFTEPGRFVLIYFNADKSVEYISEPFEVTAS